VVLVAVVAVVSGVWGDQAAGFVVGVVGAVVGIVGVGLAWAPLRGSRAVTTPEEMADGIAAAVRRRWEAEVELRRVNDPYTIPVCWEPADPDLMARWVEVERAAVSAGWRVPERSRWASGPTGLAGGGDDGGDLVEVLGRVPSRRLVVLGEPGAGKTIMAVRLVLDMLEPTRRAPGGPVPVLVPLASWDPGRQGLWDWLEGRLCLDHPALRTPAPGGGGVRWARVLWEKGLLLPVLDGLDEVAGPARGRALAGVNAALRPGVGLVLTARTGPYRAAVHPEDGTTGVVLAGAAGVELRPLDADTVADYLRAAAGGPGEAARWDRVVGVLADPAHPVGQALVTPLAATLARTVYGPRPGESAAGLPHPDALLGPGLNSQAAVQRHLFDGFVPAAYRPHPDPALRCRWEPADARRWLVFLARRLELRRTTDLAWWELHTAVPRLVFGLVFGLVAGLAGGLVFGLAFGLVFGLAFGLAFGLVFGLTVGLTGGLVGARAGRPGRPARGLRWSPDRGLLAFGLVFGLVGGLGVGLAVGLAVWLVGGLGSRPVEPAEAADPRSVFARDRGAFRAIVLAVGFGFGLVFGLAGGLAGGLVFGLVVGLMVGLAFGFVIGGGFGFGYGLGVGIVVGFGFGLVVGQVVGLVGGLVFGLVFGLGFGLVVGLRQTAWGWFAVARCWLALRGRLPWRLMGFLADAHQQRGVLRQAGAVYQFRHVELQRHLAGRL
jgi:hypothetical protein